MKTQLFKLAMIISVFLLHLQDLKAQNTRVGVNALPNNNGTFNTAIGYYVMYPNTTGKYNTGLGAQALRFNTSGFLNTALGANALYSNKDGYYNTATGTNALFNNTSGFNNTATGLDALNDNTIGSYNTAVGNFALFKNTTLSGNTAIGYNAGNFTYSASYSTSLGYGAGAINEGLTNWTSVGYNSTPTASNQVMLGNASVTSVRAAGGFVIYSDGRFKKNIKADVPGLDFINALKPVTYNYDIHGLNERLQPQSKNKNSNEKDGSVDATLDNEAIRSKEKKLYTGFVAQEVEEAATKLNYDFSGVYKPQSDQDVYGLSYADFVVPLVKAVQELNEENRKLKSDMQELKNAMAKLTNASVRSGNTSVNASSAFMEKSAVLEQNAPNPFYNSTVIRYRVPSGAGPAKVVVTDMTGAVIRDVSISAKGAGQLIINSNALAAGAYNYTLWVNGKQTETRQMVVSR